MCAGRTWNSAGPSQWSVSYTIGNANPDMGPNKTVDLDNAMSAKICMIWDTCGGDKDDKHGSTNELESHANMSVVGRQETVFHTGKTADVRAFSDEVDKLESVPIVDASLAYKCPKTFKTYLLIVKNDVHIPLMQPNLIPLFIMREANLEVNDVPRIHIRDELIRESHSIMILQVDLQIPFQLSGVFSYFATRSLINKEIEEFDWMYMVLITPDTNVWDPYCDSYADQEENFLDFRGELKHPPEPKWREIIDGRDYIN